MSTAASEEPLLRTEPQPSQNRDDASPRPEKGRFDRFQLLLVLLIQVAEPITATVIFPFVNQFVRETGITDGDERKTGYYAGMIESLFFVTEALTVYHWGVASDAYGRKPILLIGLLMLVFSTLGFGLSRTFWAMMIFRALQGITNGNIGVTKSIMAEISDPSTITYVFSTMSIMWATGTTVGPVMGGLLARPAERWPPVFASSFWYKYPYFLPCAAAALVVLLTVCISSICLKETNPTILKKRAHLRQSTYRDSEYDVDTAGYGTLNSAPSTVEPVDAQPTERLMTTRTMIPIANIGFLAFVQQCISVLNPLVFSTSIEYGGLGMDPYEIGTILGIWGVANGFIQLFVSHRLIEKLGARTAYKLAFANQVTLLVCLAAIGILVPSRGVDTLIKSLLVFYLCLVTFTSIGYASIYVFIIDSASDSTLGSINGLSQMVASIMRALAPTIASSLYSVSLQQRYFLGGTMVYWILIGITISGIYMSTKLPTQLYRS
ncbi:MFS transporter [Pterulicium gracile]|uniref:MFS transporter n=1 Tax=Pterulicium gracile TaxID=1884261 RepID=A0A5C3QAP2_9AGAR|nr:MFS transporter [Pterula gracilis]